MNNNKYELAEIRRRSRNNGINFCTYYVIVDKETKEIVDDYGYKKGAKEHKERALYRLWRWNNGEITK